MAGGAKQKGGFWSGVGPQVALIVILALAGLSFLALGLLRPKDLPPTGRETEKIETKVTLKVAGPPPAGAPEPAMTAEAAAPPETSAPPA
ncbi:MAG: hypothetical protein AB1896_12490, partial [Thermodesulfobacteriota bacterium]